MKFLIFNMCEVPKVPEVGQLTDKLTASLPPGINVQAIYATQGLAFPGQPANTLVAIAIVEAESNLAIAAFQWPISVAGATLWTVPALEVPVGGAAEVEKKARG